MNVGRRATGRRGRPGWRASWCAWAVALFVGVCSAGAQEKAPELGGSVPSLEIAGPLFIIGGGSKPRAMLERLLEMAGGRAARLVVVPAASSDPTLAGDLFTEQMRGVGAEAIRVLAKTREEALEASAVEHVAAADAVYFTGGDQSRLHDVLWGTELLEAVRALHRRGGLVAGTSAGAAVMGPLMLTGEEADVPEGEEHFARLRPGVIETRDGFGLWPEAVVDQHFLARRRNNRLLSLVLDWPGLLGVGIDESTAVVVHGGAVEVVGVGNVVVYDAREADVASSGESDLHRARGLVMHVLGPGDRWRYAVPE